MRACVCVCVCMCVCVWRVDGGLCMIPGTTVRFKERSSPGPKTETLLITIYCVLIYIYI